MIDLSEFKRDTEFYGNLNFLVTIKSFDLQAIRERYLRSRERGGRTGSVERREPSEGGITNVDIEGGFTIPMMVVKTKEPRGIACRGAQVAYSSENEVIVDGVGKITNPYFSYIHSLDFSPNGKRLLVCSSGFDCIFEYDVQTLEKTWEWFAWDHGINVSHDRGDTVKLSRYPEDAKREGYRYVDGSEAIPTAARAAFINTATYDTLDERFVFITLFHEGAVYCVDMKRGDWMSFMDGLKNPHGGHRHGEWLIATSTASGEVVIQNEHEKRRYDFSHLTGKPPELGEMEWIQNAKFVNGVLVAIDSNRTSFVIVDIEKELIDVIPYNENWAVQDIA